MYDYGNPGFTHDTGHVRRARLSLFRPSAFTDLRLRPQFTQDIWVGTETVGCAMGTCMGLMSSGQWAVRCRVPLPLRPARSS